jgi:DNA invertase Pin-like site-specific DNA recombinase
MKVAYRRVSSSTQNLDRQDVGEVEKVFEEKQSGKNTERPALQDMIAFVRDGDEVVVWSIDRLARNLSDLQSIIKQLNDKGVSITFIKEKLSFSGADDAFARLQLHLMGAFAEFERSLIKSRQADGIRKARERGVYKGRKKQIDDAEIYVLTDAGHSQNEVADQMGITRMSVYRALKKRRMLTEQAAG